MKSDFTRFQCNSLAKSAVDPLARALRRELNKRKVKFNTVQMVYSAEKTDVNLLPLNESQKEDLDEAQIMKGFRIRIVPVLGCSPALFGISIAAFVLTELGEKPFSPFVLTDVKYNSYTKIYDRFYQSKTNRQKLAKIRENEGRKFQFFDEVLDIADFVFLLKDVFKWHCVRCQKRCISAADMFIFSEEKPLNEENVCFLCKSCSKEFKKANNGEFVEKLKPTLTEIWSQVSDLKKKFDPMIFKQN